MKKSYASRPLCPAVFGAVLTVLLLAAGAGAATNPAMFVYGENNVNTPRYRPWYGSSLGAESSANAACTQIRWMVVESSPTQDEAIMGVLCTNGNLYIQTWDGDSWTSNWNTSLGDDEVRYFDIGYEAGTGDAVVVYGDTSSGDVEYRSRISGTWSAEQDLDTTIGTGNPWWVEVEADPTSDDIFVGVSTSAEDLYFYRWNGSTNTFGDEVLATTSLNPDHVEAFDIAVESTSGNAFAIYGLSSGEIRYLEYTTSWQSSVQAYSAATMGNDATIWLRADANPNNDEIAFGVMNEEDNLYFGAWDGSSWVSQPSMVPLRGEGGRTFDMAFESSSGDAVWFFAQSDETERRRISYRTWDGSSFSSVTAETVDMVDNEIVALTVAADPGSDDIVVFAVDRSNDDLYYKKWNGSSLSARTLLEGSTPDVSGGTGDEDTKQPFAVTWVSQPTAVTLMSLQALDYGTVVIVRWRTGFEAGNLGFHVYRDRGDGLERLTPELIAGSALLAGTGTVLETGGRYAWPDPHYDGTGAAYWLEDVDISGQRTWHGPVYPETAHGAPSGKGAALLSALGGEPQPLRRGKGPLIRRRMKKMTAGKTAAFQGSPPASGHALKIGVKAEGWSRIGRDELVAAGMDTVVDPRSLRLFMEGREIPMLVAGEGDGVLDPGDTVEFYGVGLDTPWTDESIYWLFAGEGRGKRMQGARGRGGFPAGASFPFTAELREKLIYFAALANGEKENFFGAVVSAAAPVVQLLPVPHPLGEEGDSAFLEVILQGVSTGRHRVSVHLGGEYVGEIDFEDQRRGEAVFAVNHGLLVNGNNAVTLAVTGGADDVSLVDSLRLTYWRAYRADGEKLRFTAEGGSLVTVDGFSNSAIRVVDVTNPYEPFELSGRTVPVVAGHAVSVSVKGRGLRTLMAFTETAVRSPSSIMDNRPSSWGREGHGAEMVIISHENFMEAAASVAALREAQGLSVALIDVEDLYDEFSWGVKTPYAIRSFLGFAAEHWFPAPRYLLLLGDASADPRNYLGLGEQDYVPTKLVDTSYLETASDDWFSDFDEDGLPSMAAGRLPVGTAGEAALIAGKILAYDSSAGGNGEALLVADVNDGFDFEEACREVGGLLPGDMLAMEVFRGEMGTSAARAELLYRLDLGPSLVNYYGHGSVGMWNGNLLNTTHAASLGNSSGLSVFVNMTCLNGLFHSPYQESLAEALLKSPGGAVAVWTSSGLTEPEGQHRMSREFFRIVFDGEGVSLGEAARRAKEATGDRDVRRTWIFFGDPATVIR